MISEKVLKLLKWDILADNLKGGCKTIGGKKRVDELTSLSKEEIVDRQTKITELKNLINQGISPEFMQIENILPLLERVKRGSVFNLEELSSLRIFFKSFLDVENFLKENKDDLSNLSMELNSILEINNLVNLIISSITEKNELNLKKFKKLKNLKENKQILKKETEKKISQLLNSSSMERIIEDKIFTTSNQRYVILIKSNMKNKINGTIHDISAKGLSLYFEPAAIKSFNDRLISMEMEIQREIMQIFANLSESIAEKTYEISNNYNLLCHWDFLNGAATFSNRIRGNQPEIISEAKLKLLKARHPILFLMEGNGVVANDIELGFDFNGVIISGANTGGKTVVLKTVGLIVILSMYGLHVPTAADSSIGMFENILADIGDDQNIELSLSSFSGQLKEINEILKISNSKTLILLDEIMAGTDPVQGAALAQSVLEKMISTNALVLATTHYSKLKELASNNKKFQNASVFFDVDKMEPTYRLTMGLAGSSYGIEIAKKYNLPEDVLVRAGALISKREMTVESLLEETRNFKQKVEEEYVKLEEEKGDIKKRISLLSEKEDKLKKEKLKLKEGKAISFIDELNRYRQSLSKHITSMQNLNITKSSKLNEKIKNIEKKIITDIKKEKKNSFKHDYKKIDFLNLKNKKFLGKEVFVVSLEKIATLQHIDLENKKADVLLGFMKYKCSFDDLLEVPGNSSAKKTTKKKIYEYKNIESNDEDKIPLTIQTSLNTIDLRGLRANDALTKMDAEMDTMKLRNVSVVIIIHGHGTGVLKKIVREQLDFSGYQKNYRAGEQNEGGDGVTIVRLI